MALLVSTESELHDLNDVLERIAASLQRVADALDPSEERVFAKIEQAQRVALQVVRVPDLEARR